MQQYTFKTLYGSDKKNNIRQWNLKVIENTSYTEIIVIYGILNGKQIETITKIDKGKNIGKKNETSHYQQALSEATSKWNKKRDLERYTIDIPDLTKGSESHGINISNTVDDLVKSTNTLQINTSDQKIKQVKPMLAHDFKKFKNKLIFPCYIQKKYDGYRMLYDPITDNLYTRTGRKFDILYNTELHEQLRKINMPLDGELYCHKDFNFECYGVLRKKKASGDDLKLLDKIEYHVYDLHDSTDNYKKRHMLLKESLDCQSKPRYSKVKVAETYPCKNLEEINNYHTVFVHDNYEGSIVRNANSLYESKRSFNLLKYKDFDDDEFTITGFTTEKDNDKDLVIWICKTKDNQSFNVRPQGTKEERRELYKHAKKYINKKLWLKFFSFTDAGIPRFPTTNRNTYTEYIRDVVE